MPLTTSNSSAAAIHDAVNTHLQAGGGVPILVIYSGTMPASAQASLSGNTVLAEVVLGNPAFTVSNKTATLAGVPRSDTAINATGTASFWRIFQSTAGTPATITNAVFQGDVGTSGADMIVSTTSFVASAQFDLNSLVINLP